MDEAEARRVLAEDFGTSYMPPNQTVEDTYEDDWFQTIEIKLSNQGKLIAGLGAVALGTLFLTVLQGKVVITLAKANRGIIETINGIVSNISGPVSSPVSYAKPEKTVDESKIDPIDQEELDELKRRMEASTKDTEEGIL